MLVNHSLRVLLIALLLFDSCHLFVWQLPFNRLAVAVRSFDSCHTVFNGTVCSLQCNNLLSLSSLFVSLWPHMQPFLLPFSLLILILLPFLSVSFRTLRIVYLTLSQ